MFKKLVDTLKNLAPAPESFDPSVFDDPVALRTEWGPAKGGGTNFRTHKLVQVDPNRMEFRASWGALTFALIFLLVGVGVVAVYTGNQLAEGELALNGEFLMISAFGSIFAAAGAGMLIFFTSPVVFDKRSALFWKGRTAPEATFHRDEVKEVAELSDIHALQVIAESVSGSKSSYTSYELNVVLTDGRRLNVIDHGDRVRMLIDAHALAEFLDKPVWNTVGYDAD